MGSGGLVADAAKAEVSPSNAGYFLLLICSVLARSELPLFVFDLLRHALRSVSDKSLPSCLQL